MQGLHVSIAIINVAFVLWRAPLSPVERTLFPFGYFFVYEYAVKSRGYGLGCLFVFLFCDLWPRRRRSPLSIALVLGLMANVEILFMIISIAAALALVVDRARSGEISDSVAPAARRWDVLSALVVVVMWAIAVATVYPPSDAGYADGWFWEWSTSRFESMVAFAADAVAPSASSWIALPAAAALMLAAVRPRRAPAATFFLAAALSGLMLFFYSKYPGNIWHHGLLFVTGFAAIWIDRASAPIRWAEPRARAAVALFALILAYQSYAGLNALRSDYQHELSRSRDVADFIAERGWSRQPLIGAPDFMIAPIIGYLGAEQAYFLNGARWGSFTVWDQKRREPVSPDQLVDAIERFGPDATWVVSPESGLDPEMLRRVGLVEAANLTGASSVENYTIYRPRADVHRRP
jgi:hypothetical protein